MANRRPQMHRLQDLVRLHRLRTGARETARLLAMSPNTERQYREALARAGLLDGDPGALPPLEALKAVVVAAHPPTLPPQQMTSLEEYRRVIAALADKGLGPRAIFDRLRLEQPDFSGSHSASAGSAPSRSAIPEHRDRAFRFMAIGDSGASGSRVSLHGDRAIPEHRDRAFRFMAIADSGA